jgi:DNA polymerase-3 subunit delta
MTRPSRRRGTCNEATVIYIMFGADDFSLREALTELKAGFGDGDSLALNTIVFEGRSVGVAELLNACRTPPFLGTHRLVIVEGLLGRFERKGGEMRSDADDVDEWKTLGDSCRDLPPSTVLVFVDGHITKGNPLRKAMAAMAKEREFVLPRGAALRDWIGSRVKARGGRISPPAVNLLAEYAGEDLWMLAGEIEKLCVYAGERRIDVADVQKLTSYAREASVFPMIDAVVEGRFPAAMRLMHELLAGGMAPQYLLAMLTRQYRLMVQALELGGPGIPTAQKRERLGLSPRYPVDKLLRQSTRYPMPRLVRAYDKLLAADWGIKTGRWSDEMALDLLVAELCR